MLVHRRVDQIVRDRRLGDDPRPARLRSGGATGSLNASSITVSYTGYSSLVISSGGRPPSRRFTSATTALGVLDRPRPGDHRQDQLVLGVVGDVVPVVAAVVVVGVVGSQFFCFLPTNAHFSSNWTSRVSGGKGHQLVVGVLGVLDRPAGPAA